ncbi:MAG TPA: hypothetical protein VGF25_03050 [Thermoleophilaceae bacterium]|jgi:hypothetical protein
MKARICGSVGVVALAVLCAAFPGMAAARGSASATRADFTPACTIESTNVGIKEGGRATITFTVEQGCTGVEVSYVAYTAEHPTWDESWADTEHYFDSMTKTLTGGEQQLSVSVPDCYFELDLVYGKPIQQEGPPGSDNFYNHQGREIRGENGGTHACSSGGTPPPPPPPLPPPPPPPPASPPPPPAAPPASPPPPPAAPPASPPPPPPAAAASPPPPPAAPPASPPPAAAPAPVATAKPAAAAPKTKQPTVTAKPKSHSGVLGAQKRLHPRKAIRSAARTGVLPFTGLPTWIPALLGAALVLAGLGVRRLGRRGETI